MKKKSTFLAIIGVFLGWSTFKHFDFDTFKFDTPVGYVYLITSLACGYFYFKPLPEDK